MNPELDKEFQRALFYFIESVEKSILLSLSLYI
jgi:hypothetical protein